MEGLFRQTGIYNPAGQNYTPVDRDQVMPSVIVPFFTMKPTKSAP